MGIQPTADRHVAPFKVKYCEGAEWPAFYEADIQRTVFPRIAVFNSTLEEADLLITANLADCAGNLESTPRLHFIGEPYEQDKLDALVQISSRSIVTVHCTYFLPCHRMRYFPFWASSFGERRKSKPSDLIKSDVQVANTIKRKTEFCAFLYSPNRDHIYDILAQYKNVSALGAAKGNSSDRSVYSSDATYNDLAVEKYQKYKFVIAGESTQSPGYITEKIISAMLAYAVPIYCGASDIFMHFNEESFVNAMRYTDEELLQEIMRLDNDPVAYKSILSKPWFVDNKLPKWFEDETQASLFSPLLDAISQNANPTS